MPSMSTADGVKLLHTTTALAGVIFKAVGFR
jgi:hypothetical protein